MSVGLGQTANTHRHPLSAAVQLLYRDHLVLAERTSLLLLYRSNSPSSVVSISLFLRNTSRGICCSATRMNEEAVKLIQKNIPIILCWTRMVYRYISTSRRVLRASTMKMMVLLLFGMLVGGSRTTVIRDPHLSVKFETWDYHQSSHKVGHRWVKPSQHDD